MSAFWAVVFGQRTLREEVETMAKDKLYSMESGENNFADGGGSIDLKKPLLSEGSSKPKHSHDRRHFLRSRKDVVLPNPAHAICSTLIVALGPLSLGFALGFTSPTQAAIIRDLNLTIAQFSTFGSILSVGCMLGAIVSGRLADYFGRKPALSVAVIPVLAGWSLIVLCKAATPLIIARTLVGFGGGIISFTVPMYIGEISPKHLRGTLGTMNQLAITIGVTLSYIVGMYFHWRTLALLGGIPGVLLVVGLLFIPESPRWLAKADRKEELQVCLQWLRGKEFNVSDEIQDIQAATEASNALPSVKWSDLKQRKLIQTLIVGVGLMVLQQFSGINAVMLYSSFIFTTAGVQNPGVATVALGILQVVMTLAAAGLIDKAGRRLLLMVSAGGMALSSFLALQPEMSLELATFIGYLALVSLLVYIAAFSLGVGAIPWIIMSEIFPAHVKGTAGSVATLVNWFCSSAVTLIFNSMLLWSSTGSFWIFAAECVGTMVFVALYVPETRGRTLEQIEASFK
ncbi:sugar transporter ERD6-like 4 isoform X2 [Physcomitrium patens]|uniref:sugar transporter ERD6-like 4 isoform X2 n=1 Tax=Physcomitrium patens TaxID=3218 RepID=UPI003CCD7A42